MKEFRPADLLTALNTLREHAALCADERGWVSGPFRSALTQDVESLAAICESSGLAVSGVSAQRMLRVIALPGTTAETISYAASTLANAIEDECQTVLFYSVDARNKKYFGDYRDGWEDAIERFPDIQRDVEEMGKCFALGRYAATVFHATLACEFGAIQLGVFIGVSDPKRGWTATINTLGNILKTPYPNRTPEQQKHSNFLEQAQGTINGITLAWRNKISHAEGNLRLMTSEFDDHVAEEIMLAARAFLRRLAVEMPQ